MKKLVVLPLTLLLVLLAAMPAAATPPVFQEGKFDDTWVFEKFSEACGFDVYVRSVGSWRLTIFFDNSGNPIGSKYFEKGTDEVYSPETSGMRLIGNFTAIYLEDYVTGGWSMPGTYFSITVPGYGIVFKDAGLWKFPHPGRIVGVHRPYRPPDINLDQMKLLCSLLSGE